MKNIQITKALLLPVILLGITVVATPQAHAAGENPVKLAMPDTSPVGGEFGMDPAISDQGIDPSVTEQGYDYFGNCVKAAHANYRECMRLGGGLANCIEIRKKDLIKCTKRFFNESPELSVADEAATQLDTSTPVSAVDAYLGMSVD